VPSPNPWTARITRAQALAERHPPAADILRFYAQLASYQQTLAERWVTRTWDPPLVIEVVAETLEWLARNGPPVLSRAAQTLHETTVDEWRLTLDRYLVEDAYDTDDAPRAFVIEAMLQPLAEACAEDGAPDEAGPTTWSTNGRGAAAGQMPRHDNRCPFCQQRPAAGVLRDAGQGTRRALVCGLCFTEWAFDRIGCPSCGEQRFDALPVYTAEQVEGVRVDGCDSCGVYLKTIDASKDGTIVPEVDDLATVTLDLWAREHGYRRLRPSFYL
jgi:FdhE protein